MVWYKDLKECDYFGKEVAESLLAIGWLERGREYLKGNINKETYDCLNALLQNPFQPVVCFGLHECDLCQFPKIHKGASNLFVPYKKKIFVCPELIIHYIEAHWYKPPAEFCDAVIACPPTQSIEYKKHFLMSGGRKLLKK